MKRFKRIITFVIAILIISTGFYGYASECHNEIKEFKDDGIISMMNNFFRIRSYYLFNNSADTEELEHYFELSEKRTPGVCFFLNRTRMEKELYQRNGMEVTNYNSQVVVKETKRDEIRIINTVTFYDKWYPNIEQRIGREYTVKYSYEQGQFTITDITSDDAFEKIMNNGMIDLMETLPPAMDFTNRMPSDLSFQDALNSERSISQPMAVGYAYINNSLFMSYANTYATTYNSLFTSYAGADCQNFASQCLWYGLGGVNSSAAINALNHPMVTSGSNARKWYRNSTGTSVDPLNHWITVESFDDMISSSGSNSIGLQGSVASGYASAGVGDIIQIDWNGDGWYDHSVVVVLVHGYAGSRTKAQIWVCGHTDNVACMQLSAIAQGVNYRTIHITRLQYGSDVYN